MRFAEVCITALQLVGAYGTGVDGGLMGEGSLLSDGLKEDELHLREADLGASVPQRTGTRREKALSMLLLLDSKIFVRLRASSRSGASVA